MSPIELPVATELVAALRPYMPLLNAVETGRREDPDRGVTILQVSVNGAPDGAAVMSPSFAIDGNRVLLATVDWYDREGRLIKTQGQRASRRW